MLCDAAFCYCEGGAALCALELRCQPQLPSGMGGMVLPVHLVLKFDGFGLHGNVHSLEQNVYV